MIPLHWSIVVLWILVGWISESSPIDSTRWIAAETGWHRTVAVQSSPAPGADYPHGRPLEDTEPNWGPMIVFLIGIVVFLGVYWYFRNQPASSKKKKKKVHHP